MKKQGHDNENLKKKLQILLCFTHSGQEFCKTQYFFQVSFVHAIGISDCLGRDI